MKVVFAWLLGCASMLVALITPACAQEARLVFGTTNSPQVAVNQRIFKPWVAKINEEGKGVLVIEQRDDPAIANSVNFYDRTINDVVQISFGVMAYVSGKFDKSQVVGLPVTGPSARQASVAYWRLFQSGLLASEYTEIVPLMMSSFAANSVHFTRPPKTLDNLQGLKIIAGSKGSAQFAARLGAAPLTLPITESYSAMQRGTADGIAIPWTTFPIFKYDEVTQYHVPNASLGTAVGVVFISKKAYDALPEAARKVLDANRGEKQSRELGAFWDMMNEEGRKYTMSRPNQNHTSVDLTPEQLKIWNTQAEAVAAEWAKTAPDGERLLSTYSGILAKVQAEEPNTPQR